MSGEEYYDGGYQPEKIVDERIVARGMCTEHFGEQPNCQFRRKWSLIPNGWYFVRWKMSTNGKISFKYYFYSPCRRWCFNSLVKVLRYCGLTDKHNNRPRIANESSRQTTTTSTRTNNTQQNEHIGE